MASFHLADKRNDRPQDAERKEKIYICERHFKAECILTARLMFVWCSVNYLAYTAHCDEYLNVCSLKLYSSCIFLIGVRKTLVTGSIPTENVPKKSSDATA